MGKCKKNHAAMPLISGQRHGPASTTRAEGKLVPKTILVKNAFFAYHSDSP